MAKRAKTLKYASDDHAGDLLADILASTAEAAERERQAVEHELTARKQAEEQAKAEAHAERIAARQAKLQEEMARQDELAKRRTMRMKALEPQPEPEAVDEPSEPQFTIDEDAIRRQIAEEVREELRAIAATPMPEPMAPPRRAPTGLMALAAAVAAGVVGVAAFAMSSSYTPDPNPYAKAVFAPMDRNAVALEIGSTPIPKLEEVQPAAPKEVAKRPTKIRRPVKEEKAPAKSAFAKPKEKSKAAASYDKLKSMLDDSSDPFSMD